MLMSRNWILVLVLLISACKERKQSPHRVPDNVVSADTSINQDSATAIIETFTDSTQIGLKGKSKVDLIKHRVFDHSYVIARFYTRGVNGWIRQNLYLYECDALMDLQPQIGDFNNDGLNDITFISGTAARGANEVRRLFLYDREGDQLISIVNAQDFPNMQYNEELDCIDAFLITGGATTVFARIERDSLIEFASVSCDGSGRTVYERDRQGREHILREDLINSQDVYTRYKNYNPLKVYPEK